MSDIDISKSEEQKKYLTVDNYSLKDSDISSEAERVIPREIQSGVTRGTQRIVNKDNSYITLGVTPGDDDLSIAFFTRENKLTQKITGNNMSIYEAGTNNVKLFSGYNDSDLLVIRLAKDGFDARTTESNNLVWSSEFNLFKIVESKEIDFNTPGVADGASEETSISIVHNHGFIPLVVAFVTYPSVGSPGGEFTYQFGSSRVQTDIVAGNIEVIFCTEEEIIATDSRITFYQKISNATGSAHPALQLKIKYFILAETAPE